ncbi:tetratricopeptide repeat protein [Nostoc sp.]|uniref:tetratricopeptide repeat protein n=1 Tax=Nostoc sp. TaxID=1180 RepID=UPI002FF4A419
MSQEIDFLAVVGKLSGLSLVESATTHPSQPANYRVTTILESLLEKVLIQEEWQAARQQAVREIHQVWWEENHNRTEAEGLEIVRLGLLAKEQEIAVSVGDRIGKNWVNNSRFLEALELCKQVLAVFQDYRILGTVSYAEEVLGFVQEAVIHYQQALDLCPEEELTTKATTLNNMARIIAQQGDVAKAIALWEESLELFEQIDYAKGKAATINNMARIIAQQGDVAKAIALWEESLKLFEQIDDAKGKAATINNMAQIIAQQGDVAKAIALWEQSLEIKEQIGDVKGTATTLNNMAQVIADQGDVAKAIALWEQSLEIIEQIGDVKSKAATLNNMALVIAQQGDIPKALSLWEQSLKISEQIGDVGGKATNLNNMAGVFANQGEISKAIMLWEQSLELFEQIGDPQGKASNLNNMARVIAQQGYISKALALWEQSLEIIEQIGDAQGKASTLNNMAGVFANQGEISKAIALWEQVVSTLAQISAYSDLVTVLSNLGLTDESNGLVYLAQAIWLTLRIQAPLVDTIQLISALYNKVPQSDELEAVLGATAMFLCNSRGEGHPQLEKLQEDSFKIILGAANAQGIETQEAFGNWFTQQRLNDPEYFLPRLNQRLEEIVGDGWLFDPSQVVGE